MSETTISYECGNLPLRASKTHTIEDCINTAFEQACGGGGCVVGHQQYLLDELKLMRSDSRLVSLLMAMLRYQPDQTESVIDIIKQHRPWEMK